METTFEAVTGLQKIDGKLYYFSPALLTDTSVTADQKSYLCRQDGTVVELTNNDWTFAENAWYYVKDHTVLKNCIAKIKTIIMASNLTVKCIIIPVLPLIPVPISPKKAVFLPSIKP